MKQFVFVLLLATMAACSGARGTDTARVTCPDDPNKQLSRDEWKACFGRQDHDGKGGK